LIVLVGLHKRRELSLQKFERISEVIN
jgi:hypothetical protein